MSGGLSSSPDQTPEQAAIAKDNAEMLSAVGECIPERSWEPTTSMCRPCEGYGRRRNLLRNMVDCGACDGRGWTP